MTTAERPTAERPTAERPTAERPALDPALVDLLGLFAGPLSAVRFPEVDHETLGELATSVERGHAEVEEARALLAAAEATLDARRQELVARAQRAKAYARIYAEGQPALQAQLDCIVLPKAGARPATVASEPGGEPRKRGRPRKIRDDAQLFGVPASFGPAALPAEAAPAAE